MKFKPLSESKKEKVISFTDFSGGINKNASEENLEDNQLRDGINVYSEFGSLKTRPALHSDSERCMSTLFHLGRKMKTVIGETELTNVKEYKRLGITFVHMNDSLTFVTPFLITGDNKVKQLEFSIPRYEGSSPLDCKNVLIFEGKRKEGHTGIYCVMPFLYYSANNSKQVFAYEVSNDFNNLIPVNKAEFYAPMHMVNLKGDNWSDAMNDISFPSNIEYILKPNLLGGGRTAFFTVDSHSYSFTLPYRNIDSDADILVSFRLSERMTRRWKIPAGENAGEEINGTPQFAIPLTVHIDRQTNVISFKDTNGDNYILPYNGYCNQLGVSIFNQDNEALYDYIVSKSNLILHEDTLFSGGYHKGKYGIMAFDKDEKTYLPEDGITVIDNINSEITAIATQGKYTVAFKKDSLYRINFVLKSEEKSYMFYRRENITVYGYDITYEKINGVIGCDCPDTVRLCNNRLVWLNSDGCIYTLYGSNRYTEGSIYELSSSISKAIKSEENPENVYAGVYNNNYMLFFEKRMYIMNTNVANFRYLSGAGRKINRLGGLPFYIFTVPENYHILGAIPVKNGIMPAVVLDRSPAGGTFTAAAFSGDDKDIFYEFRPAYGYDYNFDLDVEYDITANFLTKCIKLEGNSSAVRRTEISVTYKSSKPLYIHITDSEGKKIYTKTLEKSENERTGKFCYVGILPEKIRIKGEATSRFEMSGIVLKYI